MKNRPTASGEIDETDDHIHTGFVNFPDDRVYKFWYHADEAKIFWGNDRGKTSNVWTGALKPKGRVNPIILFGISLT